MTSHARRSRTASMPTLVLFVACFCAGISVALVVQGQEVYIGNGVYLPDTNLIETALNPLRSIFEGNISAFLREEPYRQVVNSRQFMGSSESIHTKLGSSFGLTAPVKVLELSFQASFKSITGGQSNVTSALVQVESYSKRLFLRTEVPRTVVEIPLRVEFLSDLRALPEPPSGHLPQEWDAYQSFLRKWGSHYVTNIFYGSWLRQWSIASSSLSYSERAVEARACAALQGTVSVPSITGCTGFNTSELTNSLSLNMHDQIEVRGGEPTTASAIAIQRTEALVSRFIQEGASSDHVVRYGFDPVWAPVLARFGLSTSKERRVAMALEAYYNGFVAFRCSYLTLGVTSPPTIMQEFRKRSSTALTYQCVRACTGCRRNNDCNYQASGGCWCYGNSCIVALGEDGRAIVQTTRDNLPRNELPNRSCEYNVLGARCDCNTQNKEPYCDLTDNTIQIWDQTS